MKHGVKQRKFGRVKAQRTALLRSLAISLIEKERITTTLAKAKELRPFVEPIITRAGEDTLANRRKVLSSLNNNKEIVKKLFGEIGPRYADRPGGYTRIFKLPPRESDASSMAVIELV